MNEQLERLQALAGCTLYERYEMTSDDEIVIMLMGFGRSGWRYAETFSVLCNHADFKEIQHAHWLYERGDKRTVVRHPCGKSEVIEFTPIPLATVVVI